MTRLEELEEQSRHLMDTVRAKRRKVEDVKNDLKVKYALNRTSCLIAVCLFSSERNGHLKNYSMIKNQRKISIEKKINKHENSNMMQRR